MKKILVFTILVCVLMIPVSVNAKNYNKKSGEYNTRNEVVITVSEDITKTIDISLGQFKAILARERQLRDGYIASVIVMEAELILYQAEADKAILKIE